MEGEGGDRASVPIHSLKEGNQGSDRECDFQNSEWEPDPGQGEQLDGAQEADNHVALKSVTSDISEAVRLTTHRCSNVQKADSPPLTEVWGNQTSDS